MWKREVFGVTMHTLHVYHISKDYIKLAAHISNHQLYMYSLHTKCTVCTQTSLVSDYRIPTIACMACATKQSSTTDLGNSIDDILIIILAVHHPLRLQGAKIAHYLTLHTLKRKAKWDGKLHTFMFITYVQEYSKAIQVQGKKSMNFKLYSTVLYTRTMYIRNK